MWGVSVLLCVALLGCVCSAKRHTADAAHKKHHNSLETHTDTSGGQLVVVFSDAEGVHQLVDSVVHDVTKLASAARFVYAGDMFDPKPGVGNQKQLVDTLHANHAQLVYGNRDLNKLRMITESSEKFLTFLGEHHEHLAYIVMRLYYWVYVAKRANQIKSIETVASALHDIIKGGKAEKSAIKKLSQWKSTAKDVSEYFKFLGSATLGCDAKLGCEFVKSQLGTSEDHEAPLFQVVHDYFTKDKQFVEMMQKGEAFHFEPQGCEATSTCTTLVTHSGLADFDMLLAVSAHPTFHLDTNVLSRAHALDPYQMLGGVFSTASLVNAHLRASVSNAFRTASHSPAALVAQLKAELARSGADFQDLKADVHAVFTNAHKLVGFGSSLSDLVEAGIRFLQKENPAKDMIWASKFRNAMKFFGQPLHRGGNFAIDASLPFPLRSGFLGSSAPGVTTNNPLQFYQTLQMAALFGSENVLANLPPANTIMANICHLHSVGLRFAVFGHIAMPGPSVVRFPASVLVSNCISARSTTEDFVVVFIDQSSFRFQKSSKLSETVLTGKREVKFAYYYSNNGGSIHKLRFGASLAGDASISPFEVDLVGDRHSGLPISIPRSNMDAILSQLRQDPKSQASIASMDEGAVKQMWEGVSTTVFPVTVMRAALHTLAGVAKSEDAGQVQIRCIFAHKTDSSQDSLWLFTSVDIGSPFTGSSFYFVEATNDEIVATKHALQAGIN